MENNHYEISETFGRDFGDFALLSSDDVLFYMPRALLQYSSKVFATMFEIGDGTKKDDTPILMQADARILRMILTFSHPGLPNPKVKDIVTLSKLFQIAKQYEMDGVLDILQSYFMAPGEVPEKSLLASDPLASLAVAYAFNCMEHYAAATMEVVRCEIPSVADEVAKFEIPMAVLQPIMITRGKRMQWYIGRILDIGRMSMARANQHNFLSRAGTVFPWMQRALEQIVLHPNLAKFKDLYASALEAQIISPEDTWRQMREWEVAAVVMESSLE